MPERLEVLEHDRGQVVPALLGPVLLGLLGREPGGERGRLHAGRVRARGVEQGPAGAIDRPRVAPIERAQVVRVELATGLDVGQALPAAADADDLHAELGRAVGHALDDRVEARHVAAAREHADPLRHCHRVDGSEPEAAAAYDPARELRAVHGRGAGRGEGRGRARRATARRRRGARRGDGRPRRTTGSGRRTTRPPTPSSSRCARPPGAWARTGYATSTMFCTMEPCPMCVGRAARRRRRGARVRHPESHGRRRRHDAPARRAPGPGPPGQGRQRHPPRRGRGAVRSGCAVARERPAGILPGGEVSEWLMVPLSKSGVREHRGFESLPLRHALTCGRPMPALAPCARSLTHARCARSRARRRLGLVSPSGERQPPSTLPNLPVRSRIAQTRGEVA